MDPSVVLWRCLLCGDERAATFVHTTSQLRTTYECTTICCNQVYAYKALTFDVKGLVFIRGKEPSKL